MGNDYFKLLYVRYQSVLYFFDNLSFYRYILINYCLVVNYFINIPTYLLAFLAIYL